MMKENELAAGIDVSCKYFDMSLLDHEEQVLLKGRRYANDPHGWEQAYGDAMKCLERTGKRTIRFGMESTSNMHVGLANYLRKRSRTKYEVRVLNGQVINCYRKTLLLDNKNDKLDSLLIADYLVKNDMKKVFFQASDEVLELQHMMRARRHAVEDRTWAITELHRLLREVYPGYRERVKKLGLWFFVVLGLFLTPDKILAAGYSALKALRYGAGNKYKLSDKNIKVMMELAEMSPYRGKEKTSLLFLLKQALEEMAHRNKVLKEIEEYAQTLHWQLFPEDRLTKIPGVGWVTAATVRGEVGDGSSFAKLSQFIGYTGLYPKVEQSGTTSKVARMTKKGNRPLKTALILATANARQSNPIIKDHAERLKAKGKHEKTIRGALARHLAVIIFAIMRDNTKWDDEKAMKSLKISREMRGLPKD